MVQSAPTRSSRPRRAPRHRAGVRTGRDAARRAHVRRERGVPADVLRRAAGARAHLLRPARGVRRRWRREPARPLRGDRGAHLGRLAHLLGDRAGRLLRRAAARARLRGAEAPLAAVRSAAPSRPRARSRSRSPSTAPTPRRSRRPRSSATAATSSTGARSSSATARSPTSASSSRPSSPAAARAASRAFVVEKDDDGFVRGPRLPKMGSRCFPAAEVAFEDCFVPERPAARRRRCRLPRPDVGLRRRARPARGRRRSGSAAQRSSSPSSTRRSARHSDARSTSSRPSRSGSPTRS